MADSETPRRPRRFPQHWDGKLLDVSGVSAKVALDLHVEDGVVEGEFRADLLPEVDDACGTKFTAPPTVGKVGGRVDDDGRLHLVSELDLGQGLVVVEFDARPGDPDPHARAAFYGTFGVVEGAKDLTLQGGGVVLWAYSPVKDVQDLSEKEAS